MDPPVVTFVGWDGQPPMLAGASTEVLATGDWKKASGRCVVVVLGDEALETLHPEAVVLRRGGTRVPVVLSPEEANFEVVAKWGRSMVGTVVTRERLPKYLDQLLAGGLRPTIPNDAWLPCPVPEDGPARGLVVFLEDDPEPTLEKAASKIGTTVRSIRQDCLDRFGLLPRELMQRRKDAVDATCRRLGLRLKDEARVEGFANSPNLLRRRRLRGLIGPDTGEGCTT